MVSEDRLVTSLNQIRQAASEIWANDNSLRIIRDFTDHGPEHSERLTAYAAKIVAASSGQPLTSEEAYLLQSGIYLHDIGMQCDVLRLPDIKKRAEDLGAQFDVTFTASTSSSYSVQEQNAIRKNHHLLTAAWIDYAYRTGKTALGNAAQSIPADLVADLMDVCKHHTTLPIGACPVVSKFDPTLRKRFVAALLRLADELDVDSNRVSLETVKTFRIDPQSGAFWWLHNRTKVIFPSSNVIQINVRLHPADSTSLGSLIRTSYITGLQVKNQSVLSVLAQHGIPLVISADSGVTEDEYAERLPNDIAQALLESHVKSTQTSAQRERLLAEILSQTLNSPKIRAEDIWTSAANILDFWRKCLNVEYVGFFAGGDLNESILTQKAAAGLFPFSPAGNFIPHFNWRKAGLTFEAENAEGHIAKDWLTITFADWAHLAAGFNPPLKPESATRCALIPARLPRGPAGLLVIGNATCSLKLPCSEDTVVMCSREITFRLLNWYLALLVDEERSSWQRTAMLTAHRIRSCIQSIASELRILQLHMSGDKGFSAGDAKTAQERLRSGFAELMDLSYGFQSPLRALDVRTAVRHFVPIEELLHSAVVASQDVLERRKVTLDGPATTSPLPSVWVNQRLMVYAYSALIDAVSFLVYQIEDSHQRIVKVEAEVASRAPCVWVRIRCDGLDAAFHHLERAFKYGVGIQLADKWATERTPVGWRSLWEAKWIIDGHGGEVKATCTPCGGEARAGRQSKSFSVCFSVALPVAKNP